MKDATKPIGRTNRFTKASAIVDSRIGTIAQSRGFLHARLLTHWDDIIGPSIAAIARPIRVTYSRSGIGARLTLLVDGANAPQVQMQIPEIIKRVNGTYGFNAIQTIKLTQTSAENLIQAPRPSQHKDTKALSAETSNKIDKLVAPVADRDLKAALSDLGRHIAANQSKGTK